MIGKQKHRHSKQQTFVKFQTRKQIRKQEKIRFENSDGVGQIRYKKCFLTIPRLLGD